MAAAPNKETKDTTKLGQVETNTESVLVQWGQVVEIDNAYLQASWTTKFWRSALFQMILFGCLSFVGPAMSDAISNLGGGGLSTPFLANLATSLNYAAGFATTMVGGPVVNKLGIKLCCILAALAMPLAGSGYYVNAKFGVDWYLLFSRAVGGVFSGLLYVSESTAMLSYPHPNDRGLYLGIWSAMRNTGSVIGGAINFSNNSGSSKAGGVAWSTYLIFIAFESTGIIYALMLSKTRKVRRPDGTGVAMAQDVSWGQEFKALLKHMKLKKTWLMFVPAFYSFFYGGTNGTYLSLHFSVRARALSSLLGPTITIPMVIAFGKLLDTKRWPQRKRAWLSFLCWIVPQAGCFIWIGIEYSKFGAKKAALDYEFERNKWAEAYIPYLLTFGTGYVCQLSIYWILGTFSTDMKSAARTGGLFRAFETLGQTVSYAINSNKKTDPRRAFYVNCGIMALTIPCMIGLIGLVPEAPADYDIDVEGPVPREVVPKAAEENKQAV